MTSEQGTILLVDDNPDDYEATYRSLRKNKLMNPVQWCQSGQDAKDYLYREGKHSERNTEELPTLMLLDLNMPGMDGRQLLKCLKQNKEMSSIPVVVLTTSNNPNDIDECYALGASTFIQKPVDFDGLTEAVRTMKEYWFGIALLPTRKE